MSIKRLTQIGGLLLVLIIIGMIALRLLVPTLSPEPETLGVVDGELSPCPDAPNCVNSFASDEEHGIESIAFSTSAAEAQETLLAVLGSVPRSTIETAESNYVHATFRSPTMGYIDDGEFLIDEETGVIHVRMAARLGQADMNANRERVEEIREQFRQRQS